MRPSYIISGADTLNKVQRTAIAQAVRQGLLDLEVMELTFELKDHDTIELTLPEQTFTVEINPV